VFCTSTGLTTSAVAVSSKAKALEAFGTTQDLFKQGLASETSDAELVQAALARPGEVITRSALDPSALEAALAAAPKPARKARDKGAKGKAEPPPTARRGPPPALVARVRRLEERLAELEQRREAEKAEFAERRAALDELEAEVKATFKRKRKELTAELETARAAVRAEGG
jgi:hypothetical protein